MIINQIIQLSRLSTMVQILRRFTMRLLSDKNLVRSDELLYAWKHLILMSTGTGFVIGLDSGITQNKIFLGSITGISYGIIFGFGLPIIVPYFVYKRIFKN